MDNVQTPGGNTTTAGAVEMARRIVEKFYGLPASKVPDNCAEVAIALAAIIETQERDAALVEHWGELVTRQNIAAAIRSGQQFRKDV